ncbi:hypothetical protein [Nocardioides sp. W7]|uniref:hypothetical protein n=1 Tax=Nocardioides sp. W7 TaxID=2931390 RepID=UPI001FD1E436|nr:hypothetical protein [Nocardioides sp. W7]
MRPLRLGTTLGVVALTLALGSCSSDTEEPKTLELDATPSASPTPSAEPGETPSGEPADDAIPTSYPEIGLEFSALPQASGPEAAALATYVEYERGLRELSRTGELNPLLTDNAAPSLTPTLESTVAYLRDNDTRYDGEVRIDVDLEGAGPRAAALTLCTDASDLKLVKSGRPGPVEGLQRAVGRVVLTAADGTWVVTQYDTLEESC